MRLEIFNFNILKNAQGFSLLSIQSVEQGYKKIFRGYNLESVNIVFVESEYIQELNKQYRGIDSPTDVLSFNMSLHTGEVYICPEYVSNSFKEGKFDEEILRLIIHGTLHILGYNHKKSMSDSPKEEMFKHQEGLVVKYTRYVHNNRVRQPR